MTNTTALPVAGSMDQAILDLAHVGGTRRPVKIVEHPAFRNHPRRTDTLRTSTVPRIPMSMRVGPLDITVDRPRPVAIDQHSVPFHCQAA